MSRRIEFILLGMLGVVVVLVAAYTQWLTSDMAQNPPLLAYLKSWPWWTIVGVPFLLGSAFIVAACIALRTGLSGASSVRFFLICEIVAVAAALAVGGVGWFAAIFCAFVLAYVALRSRRNASG